MIKKLFIYFMPILILSCNSKQEMVEKPNEIYKSGVLVSKNYLWSINTTNKVDIANGSNLEALVIHEDFLLIGTQTYPDVQITLIDYNTGETKWTISEGEIARSFFQMLNSSHKCNFFVIQI